MKRLKLICPFGGKKYPIIVTITLGIMTAMTALYYQYSLRALTAAVMFVTTATLLICWVIENIPTEDERELIAYTEAPVWMPLEPSLHDHIQNQPFPGKLACIGAFWCFCFVITFLTPKRGDPNPHAAFISGMIGAAILTADWISRLFWRVRLDESAVRAIIPIDHTYDITTTEHRRVFGIYETSEHSSSYLVFYLPDGKYVLPLYDTEHSVNSVVLVKCHGMLRWTLAFRDKNEVIFQ